LKKNPDIKNITDIQNQKSFLFLLFITFT
jgi:hypothetical protein